VTREHSPRPGATWETTIHRAETVIQDDPLDCRYCGVHADEHGHRYHHRIGLHHWHPMTLDQFRELHGQPMPSTATVDTTVTAQPDPAPNRANRRAQARANRQKGHR
jgi:hypothetical protein